MTSRSPESSNSRSSRFTISLILGLLLIPLSAVAAAAVISNDEAPPAEVAAAVGEVAPTTTTALEGEAVETVFVTEPPVPTKADLEAACGDEGWDLVEREVDGSITDLEQAALDALRQICAEEGFEFPGPPALPAVVRTVTVVDEPANVSGDPTTTTTLADDMSTSKSDEDHGDDDDSHDDDHDGDDDDHDDDDDDDDEDRPADDEVEDEDE